MKTLWGVVLRVTVLISSVGFLGFYVVPLSCSYMNSPTPDEREAAGNYVDYVLAHSANDSLRKAELLIKAQRKRVVVEMSLPQGLSEEAVVSEFSKALTECKLKHVRVEFGKFETARVANGSVEFVQKTFKPEREVDLR